MSIFATTDFLIEVSKGNIQGHTIIHKFGRSAAVPNGAFIKLEAVASNPAFLEVATPVRIAAGNAADSAAGANAQSITLDGIISDLTRKMVTLATAGASPSVDSADSFFRVDRAFVGGVGTYGVNNLGIVQIEPTGGGTAIIGISAGFGQSQHGVFTVPTGFSVEFLGALITVDANKPANIIFNMRENFNNIVAPMSPTRLLQNLDGVDGFVSFQPRSPQRFQALTDIWFEASGSGATTAVSVDFEMLLIDNDFL